MIGQLKEVPLNVGDTVEANTVVGYVSKPTKYYSLEGCNVYYAMKKDGQPVNPTDYMGEQQKAGDFGEISCYFYVNVQISSKTDDVKK